MKVRIFVTLNFVLLFLVVAIAVQCFAFGRNITQTTTAQNEQNEEVTYNLHRNATPCASESLLFASVLGSSQDERLVDCFTVGERIFVFGVSDGNDYDFSYASERSFMAVYTDELKVSNLYFIEGKLSSVYLCEGGFICLSEKDGAFLLAVYSTSGEKLRSRELIEKNSVKEPVLFSTNDDFTLVSSLKSSSMEKRFLKVRKIDSALNFISEIEIHSTFSLYPIDCYAILDKTYLFCQEKSDLSSHLTLVKINEDSEVSMLKINESSFYSCHAVFPIKNGWATLISNETETQINLVSNDGLVQKTHYVSGKSDQASVIFMGTAFYFSLKNGDEYEHFACDDSAQKTRKLDCNAKEFYSSIATNQLGVCIAKSELGLTIIGANNSLNLFVSGEFLGGKIISLSTGYYIVSSSFGANGDIPLAFGKSDIFLAKLNI